MRHRALATAGVLFVCLTRAAAQDASAPVHVHGLSERAWGKTNGNAFLVGDQEGSFGHGLLGLAVSAEPSEKLHLSTQMALEEDGEATDAELEYAFAEWRFSDALKLLAGRVKQPFGIYTEIFHVGTLRPFYGLPQGIYGPAGIVAEGYDGVGLTGRKRLGRSALQYDVYGGGIRIANSLLALETGQPEGEKEGIETIRGVVGGRVVLETALAGLAFGASAYTGSEDTVRHSAFGVQGEYLGGHWQLRSELVRHKERSGPRTSAAYFEAARRLGARFQLAGRYDYSKTTLAGEPLGSLGRHEDVALGVNYWFHPQFVVRLSYHRVDGNRFARPETTAGEAPSLAARTRLILIGTQFSF